MEQFWPLVLGGLGIVATGGWSLAIYFMRLVYRGQLVPVHELNEWRAESRIKDQQITVKDGQIAEKDKQLGHMAEVGRMVQSIMGAIQTRASDDKAAP